MNGFHSCRQLFSDLLVRGRTDDARDIISSFMNGMSKNGAMSRQENKDFCSNRVRCTKIPIPSNNSVAVYSELSYLLNVYFISSHTGSRIDRH